MDCEVCGSTKMVCLNHQTNLYLCHKHRSQINRCGKLIQSIYDYPKEDRICGICRSTKIVKYSKKFNKLLCNKHYLQLNRHGRIMKRTIRDPNEIIIHDDYVEICLYNKGCEEIARTKIDLEDIDRCKKYKWCLDGNGYVICTYLTILLHKYIKQYSGNLVIDHEDGNPLNNRKYNLRICTHQKNSFNSKLSKNNTSGYSGIYYIKNTNKWVAQITCNYKTIHLGTFDNKEDAIKAREEAEIKYFKEFRYKGDNNE